jgi:hypothetical protein
MAAGRLTGGILSPWSCDDQHFRTHSPDRLRDQRLVEGELARRDGGRLARDDDRGLLVVRRLLEQQGVGLLQMNQQIEKSRGQLFLKSCSWGVIINIKTSGDHIRARHMEEAAK